MLPLTKDLKMDLKMDLSCILIGDNVSCTIDSSLDIELYTSDMVIM